MLTEKQCFHQHVSHRLMRLSSPLTSRPLSNLVLLSHAYQEGCSPPKMGLFFLSQNI
jgi:hypothetical protein